MAETWEVRGILVRFGVPDLVNDIFDDRTEFFLEPDKSHAVPVYFNHGLDQVLDSSIGTGRISLAPEGVAIKARIDLPNGYGAAMRRLTRDTILGWSSGSAGHLVRREKRGNFNYVKVWPIVEASMSPSPMMPIKASRVMMKHFDFNQAAQELMAELELHRTEWLIAEMERAENFRR